MSISSQIERLRTAKTAIINAIKGKGVSVPSTATLDGLGEYVGQIQTGVTPEEPSISVSSTGLITASANGLSATKQLTTQVSKTITPTKSTQTAVASGRYTTGTVSVGAIPSEYIVPSGSQTITKNDTYDVTSIASVVVNVPTSGGGLPSGFSAIESGKITVSSDFTTSRQTFTHGLGVVPDMVMVYATANVATTYSMLFAIRWSTLAYRSSAYNLYMGYHGNSTTTVTMTNSNSTSYGVSNLTASSFQLASSSSSYYWRKGTYKYLAIKFS